MLFYQIYSFSLVQGITILSIFLYSSFCLCFLANVFLSFLTFASFVTTVAARNQNKLSLNRSYRTLVTLERERGKRGVIDWEMHSQDHDSSVVSSFPGNTPTNFLLMLLLLLLSSNPSFCWPKRIGENFRNFDRKRLFSVGNVSFRVFWRAVKIGERQIHPTPDRTFLPKNYFGIFRSN